MLLSIELSPQHQRTLTGELEAGGTRAGSCACHIRLPQGAKWFLTAYLQLMVDFRKPWNLLFYVLSLKKDSDSKYLIQFFSPQSLAF